MKTMYVILLSLLSVTIASAQIKTGVVILSGTIVHAVKSTPKVVRVNFLNPFQNNAKSAAFDEQNNFCVRQEMLFTQNITVQYNGTFINLYVVPGDSVHITIDADLLDKPDFEWVTFQGDHAELTKQLNDWYHYASKIPYKKYDLDLPPQHMLTAVEMDYDRYIQELNKYALQNTIDPVIKQWAERDAKYVISNWISDYTQSKTITQAQKMERIKMFADDFFSIHDAGNFQSMMFPYHLSAYVYNVTRNDPAIVALSKTGKVKDMILAAIDLIQKEPAGINRDYMMFYFLSKQVNSNPAVMDSIGDVKKYFINPVTYRYLQAYAKNAVTLEFPRTPIEGISYLGLKGEEKNLPRVDVFEYLSKKYPGKVLYIDVYATWCSPCLEEMKYAPALQDSFKRKDVVFVNLSLQSDSGKWKTFMTKEKLPGENLFFDEDATKLFMSLYRLSGYPSYLLTNKAGKMITNTAPRPSDGKVLRDAIEKLLTNK